MVDFGRYALTCTCTLLTLRRQRDKQDPARSGISLPRTPSSPRIREDVLGSEQTTYHEFIPFRTPCYASAPSVPLYSGLVPPVMGFSSCPQVIAQGGNRELSISWVCAGSSRSKYGYLSFHIGVWMGAKIVPSTSLQSCTQSLTWLSFLSTSLVTSINHVTKSETVRVRQPLDLIALQPPHRPIKMESFLSPFMNFAPPMTRGEIESMKRGKSALTRPK